jgi:hypothetical protein
MIRLDGILFGYVLHSGPKATPALSALFIKSYCRDAATSARLNWDGNWKSQRSEKLSMAYNAVRALHYF